MDNRRASSPVASMVMLLSFVRLTLLRSTERFLTQCILVSTQPRTFVQERIRLGDATNFYRAAGFFVSAISTAFLAEVATLYLLDIGNLAEPYYWLFILLVSIPFVLLCFLFIRLVTPLSLKDVLHLSFYPIGAGVFAGAAFALVAASVVALLVGTGYIPAIKYDLTQVQALPAIKQRLVLDCIKQGSAAVAILEAGYQEAYTLLRPPLGVLSFLRPAIMVLYLVVVALVFAAAVQRRRALVFGIVLLAGLVASVATNLSAGVYLVKKSQNSGCETNLFAHSMDHVADSSLKDFARTMQDSAVMKQQRDTWDIAVRAEGRTVSWTYRFKNAVSNSDFNAFVDQYQKTSIKSDCSNPLLMMLKATEIHTFYSFKGERLTSFAITPADCAQP